jgi:ABC-type glycerol-3-phosphate transport system substrate-binding protein
MNFSKLLKATAAGLVLTVGLAGTSQAVTIGILANSSGNALLVGNQIAAELGSSTSSSLAVATYNATSAADLRASFDVLVFGWYGGGTNVDWNTRLLPYLNLGGRVIIEAPGVLNQFTMADAGFTAVELNGSGALTFDLTIPGLTDGLLDSAFSNSHISITNYSSDWTRFMTGPGGTNAGILRTFASGGAIIVSASDDFYHGNQLGTVGSSTRNQYEFARNKVDWVLAPVITPTVPEPGVITLFLVGAICMLLASLRRRVQL